MVNSFSLEGVLGNQASLAEVFASWNLCLLKINGVSPVRELRGLLASFLPNQPPAMTHHQSRGRRRRLRAEGSGDRGELMGLFQPSLQASRFPLKTRGGEATDSRVLVLF